MEYADGGSVHEYWNMMLRNESRETREAFLWLVMAKMLKAFVYLQSGHTYVPPPTRCWHHRIPRGKFVPPHADYQPWVPAIHSDAHMANVFLTFAAERGCSARLPGILLGDFSRADHKHNFFCPNGNMEFVELDYFLKGLLSLHPRPTLAIERKADEIRKRMAKGESLLELVQEGMYDECLYNFAQLDATFPKPKAVAGGGKAKVFDLSKGPNYIANLWGLREAVKVGAKSLRVLRILRDDVSEQGQVNIDRAEYVSRSDLCRLIGIPSDDGSDTDDPSSDDNMGEA